MPSASRLPEVPAHRIPPRERAHYTPGERFRILVLMRTHAWSVHEAAVTG